MRPRVPWLVPWTAGVAVLLLLVCCSAETRQPPDVDPSGPPARTEWRLSHRVTATTGLTIIGYHLDRWEESTSVRVSDPELERPDDCFVVVPALGQGGPEQKTGEKITTTFGGQPAVRNGSGADGDYLMWQRADGRWVEVGCPSTSARSRIDRVARAVTPQPTTVPVPLALDLPDGYGVSLVDVDLTRPGARIYLGELQDSRPPEPDLVLQLEGPEFAPRPDAERSTLDGRLVVIGSDDRHPVVWVDEQNQWVFVGSEVGDTGPYPNRSRDLPVLKTIAGAARFAPDLADVTSWFAADAALT